MNALEGAAVNAASGVANGETTPTNGAIITVPSGESQPTEETVRDPLKEQVSI